MAYKIRTEGAGRFPILHVEPALTDGEKVYGHSPFSAGCQLISSSSRSPSRVATGRLRRTDDRRPMSLFHRRV